MIGQMDKKNRVNICVYPSIYEYIVDKGQSLCPKSFLQTLLLYSLPINLV